MSAMDELLTFEELLEVDEEEISALLNDYEASKKLRATTSHEAFIVLPRYPQLVIDCIEYLRFNGGITREGIFRVNGDSKAVDRIRAAYEQGLFDPLSEVLNINVFDVATTLKAYFRVLRDPLIPEDIYERMKDAVDSGAELPEQIRLLTKEVSNIPTPNLQVLAYLMKFFQEVVEQQEINKMNAKNMGTCLTMSITRFEPTKNKNSSNLAAMIEIGLSTKILSLLISNVDFDAFLTPQQQVEMKKKSSYKLKAPEKPQRKPTKQNPLKQTIQTPSLQNSPLTESKSKIAKKKASELLEELEIGTKDFKENSELKEAKEMFKNMTGSSSNLTATSSKLKPKVPPRPTRQVGNNNNANNNTKKKSQSGKALEKFNIEV